MVFGPSRGFTALACFGAVIATPFVSLQAPQAVAQECRNGELRIADDASGYFRCENGRPVFEPCPSDKYAVRLLPNVVVCVPRPTGYPTRPVGE